ncbi:unnamed protein product [Bursaphelenchus okinawaensis]|uniref:Oligopeptide transporter 1 n=1 Tax=Bursaphelenchus okinawaensis TaxID=465554 RepID=A0A811KYE4_9BILA|nr:unnamed protein product [Bursaphelenchus okinawaensis]CAG9113875.1 unnamed protein product [Bursaphelenchus okinawaensis]
MVEEGNKDERTELVEAKSWSEMARLWPIHTFCIIGNEFCERFSFYGMRTVLTLYLLNVLKYNENQSTIFFTIFTASCYFTPLFGSILADSYIGKFKTIISVSIVYTLGQILLAWASVYDQKWQLHPYLDLFGLFVIAVGTGGIKPCVSPFGGDQFDKHQVTMTSLFFSVFYFSINAGSMISTFVAPIFRATPCLGQDTCYPMAFGIPAVLMIVATVVFLLGSPWYRRGQSGTNVLKDTSVCILKALKNKTRAKESRPHWLEYALTGHECRTSIKCLKLKKRLQDPTACAEKKFVNDVKTLLNVSVMFLPLIVFWTLYDQQGSVWTIQAIQMDCRLWWGIDLLPDQMQTLNAILILVMIPIFSAVVYPLTEKVVKVTPLRKMGTGGMLAALAFVISGFVQLKVNTTLPIIPHKGFNYVTVFNNIPECTVTAWVKDDLNTTVVVDPYSAMENTVESVRLFNVEAGMTTFNFKYNGSGCVTDVLPDHIEVDVVAVDKKAPSVGYIHLSDHGVFYSTTSAEKPQQGTGEHSLSVIIATSEANFTKNIAVCRVKEDNDTRYPCDPTISEDFYYYQVDYNDGDATDIDGKYPYYTKNGVAKDSVATVFVPTAVRTGTWHLYYMNETPKSVGHQTLPKENLTLTDTGVEYVKETQGGVYLMSLTGQHSSPVAAMFQSVSDNKISILWQVPQIVVITAAEIMFSITGNEFSYTEAAVSMKSVVGALFLLTSCLGDLLIVIITAIDPFDDTATAAFFYAGFMTVVIGIFILLAAYFYEYAHFGNEPNMESLEDEDDDEDDWKLMAEFNGELDDKTRL